jgi:hypothetical protein
MFSVFISPYYKQLAALPSNQETGTLAAIISMGYYYGRLF